MTFKFVPLVMALGALAARPVQAATTTIDTTKTYQTIEGIGGDVANYDGWVAAHPYKLEIYTNAFAGLNLSLLRLGDWYRYDAGFNSTGEGSVAGDIVSNANRVMSRPVPILMSSGSPPAFLKSNGQTGNGGTLLYSNGSFVYTSFAQYWYDSLQAYKSNDVVPTWISIQNEPDWAADYDSCIFDPTEDTRNGTNYASYSKALDATYQRLTNMPSPPRLLGPECVHISYNDLPSYAATMHSNSFYGVAHHLYGDADSSGTPDSMIPALQSATNIFPGKPKFMTEYGYTNMIDTACLIHNCLTVEQVAGFNYFSLIWPVTQNPDGTMNTVGGLIQIENPWNRSSWTNAPPGTSTQSHGWWIQPPYWAMKHFSCFVQPGYRRVSATDNNPNVRSSAFLSPDDLRLVVVLINTNATVSSMMTFNFGLFGVGPSSVYQTAGTNLFKLLGPLTNSLVLPPLSITTLVLDQSAGAVGPATNPSPADGTSGVPLNSQLSWTPGSNAVAQAVYLGVDSNAVAQATTASPQFQGILTTNRFYPPVAGGTTYFWRVDGMNSISTNIGTIWSFGTAPAPALVHRYSFSEAGGTTVVDSVSGPAWNGTLFNGGKSGNGVLTLVAASNQYVSLPAGIVSGLSNLTVMAWVNLNSLSTWSEILDFGSNTTTYLCVAPQPLRLAITTNSFSYEQRIICSSTFSTGVWHQVAVSLSSGTGVLYLDGVAVGTNSSMSLNPAMLGATANNYIGKSQWSTHPYMDGQMDEFRLYGGSLTPGEISATYALGPNQMLNTNSPATALSTSGTNLLISWPMASPDFTLQSSTNLASGNWVTVTSPGPQIIGTNWQILLPSPANGMQFFRLSK